MSLPTPNFTQVPNFIIDEMMAKLSHSEFKVIMLILRMTIGYHRREAFISYAQFETTCGVSDRWALKCTQKMEKLGWIEVVHGNKTTANLYRVLLKPEEQSTTELSSPPAKEVPNSVHQGTELTSAGVPNSVRSINKVKETSKEKDNVLTMPSSKNDGKRRLPVDRFISKLSPEQRKVHDQIVKFTPQWGIPPKSDDVCAWFLSKRCSVKQVADAFMVYRQDAAEAHSKGRSIDNMGGAIVAAIKSGRTPKNAAFEANKQMALASAKGTDGMEAMDKYVKFRVGNDEVQLNYDLPMHSFASTLSEYKRKTQMEYV